MKISHSIKALLLLASTSLPAKDLPYLIEVKKTTPLFTRPSTSSEKVAEAEQGTLLLFVEKSRKGIWIKLKDSDGLSGWMPLDRTDYNEVHNARASIERIQELSRLETQERREAKKDPEKKQKTKEEMMEEVMAEQSSKFTPTLRVAPLMRWISKREPTDTRIGLRVDYNFARSIVRGQERIGNAWASVEATFPAPQVARKGNDFSAAARYLFRAPLWGPFVYGPDLGYSIDKVDSGYRHHLATGLAVGPAFGPVDLMVRGSYDFFSQSRAGIEIQLGVSF